MAKTWTSVTAKLTDKAHDKKLDNAKKGKRARIDWSKIPVKQGRTIKKNGRMYTAFYKEHPTQTNKNGSPKRVYGFDSKGNKVGPSYMKGKSKRCR